MTSPQLNSTSLLWAMRRLLTLLIIMTSLALNSLRPSACAMTSRVTHDASDVTALIVVDVQNCFTSNGTLAVANGNDVIPVINDIRARYGGSELDVIVHTQDWHCVNHVSFASQHPPREPFTSINLTYSNVTGTRTEKCG